MCSSQVVLLEMLLKGLVAAVSLVHLYNHSSAAWRHDLFSPIVCLYVGIRAWHGLPSACKTPECFWQAANGTEEYIWIGPSFIKRSASQAETSGAFTEQRRESSFYK